MNQRKKVQRLIKRAKKHVGKDRHTSSNRRIEDPNLESWQIFRTTKAKYSHYWLERRDWAREISFTF